MIIQGNASDFVFRVNEGCQCLQKSDGRPGKIGRTAKIGPILAVRVNEGYSCTTNFKFDTKRRANFHYPENFSPWRKITQIPWDNPHGHQ